MSKRAAIVQLAIFSVFIAALFIINALTPSREFSEVENRELTPLPRFSLSTLFSGRYMEDFESYVTDQFFLRDGWTELKARCEFASGKHENNGVYLCEDDALIERVEEPELERFDNNAIAVRDLAESSDIPVYFALIPGAAELRRDRLPENAPSADQTALIERAYSLTASEAINIDMLGALTPHADEYIYYATDHHWTTLGAFYGYTAIMDAMGLEPKGESSFTRRTVSEDFYGTVYSSSGVHWVPPDSIEVWADAGDARVTSYPHGSAVSGLVYDESFLAKKDKYAMFMGGNTPLLRIETENESAPSLLVVRDSYMDCELPFLLAHFSELHAVDLRYYKLSLAEYIAENDIDAVLVCYNLVNFAEDTGLFLLNR